jgi:hypothetical protein
MANRNSAGARLRTKPPTTLKARLKRLGARNALDVLRLLRDSQNPEPARAEAAYLLSWKELFERLPRRGRQQAIRAALSGFWEDRPRLAWGAAYLLVAARDNRTWKALCNVVASKLGRRTRFNAVYALMMLSDRRAVGTLACLLEDKREPPLLRGQAAEALGACGSGSRRAVSVLTAALGDKSSEVRLFSANALAVCGDERAVPHLEKLLRDQAVVKPYGSVAAEARYAIRAIRQRRQSSPPGKSK